MRRDCTDAELSEEEKYFGDKYGVTFELTPEELHGKVTKECNFMIRKGIVMLPTDHLSCDIMILMAEAVIESMLKMIADIRKRQEESK
jgi:hypothetical protein